MNTTSRAGAPCLTFSARWAAMSDGTRIAVGLALALACVPAITGIALVGPLLHAFANWVDALAEQGLTPAVAIRNYLVIQYAVVLSIGLAHLRRTQRAKASRVPKHAGKPPVSSSVPAWGLGITLVAAWITSVFVSLGDVTPIATAEAFRRAWSDGLMGPLGAVFFAGVCIVFGRLRTTSENMVRMMNTAPTGLPLLFCCTALNLGLYVGLWVLTAVLLPLETDKLPDDYPEHVNSSATASSAT